MAHKNTICLWYDNDALEAATFYAGNLPDSAVTAVHHAPGDYPDGKEGDVLTVEFTVCGIPCVGLNGGPAFKHSEAFSFQIQTDDQAETDRLWDAIVGNGGQESQCGWCKDRWGISWQISPRVLIEAVTSQDKALAKRAFNAMMPMKKIDIATLQVPFFEVLMSWDAIIIGGGHNGLVCAAYLARAGKKVRVLERRGVLGGAAVTEEFHPGFRNSVASYTVSLLQPKVIDDLQLHAHGLRIINRPANNFLPLPDDRYLLSAPGRTQAEVARFSERDAQRLPAYEARLEMFADVLRAWALRAPPDLGVAGGWRALPALWQMGRLGRELAVLDPSLRQELLDLFTLSAAEYLDRWFESEPIKALFGFDGIVGNYASPYTPGSAYVLLHHVFGQCNGVKGAWGHAIGGMGAISQAIAAAARAAGAELQVDAGVRRVLVEHGSAVGVELANGEILRARAVIANVNPKLLYEQMLAPAQVPDATRERMANWRCGSGTFRMNVALSRLPDFRALPGPGDHLSAGIIMAPSLDYMDRAWLDARRDGWSREPIVEMLIPSTLDASLAPVGRHVASLFCQHVAPVLPDGRHWDDHRDTVADLMIATVDRYAPGFADSVLGRQVLSPLDLERTLGLVGGDIFHGALSANQLFSARPMVGQAGYRGALPGLYLCGSGTHPGGGVTGAPGHNAAQVVLQDL